MPARADGCSPPPLLYLAEHVTFGGHEVRADLPAEVILLPVLGAEVEGEVLVLDARALPLHDRGQDDHVADTSLGELHGVVSEALVSPMYLLQQLVLF